jgi:hypothetical protein
MQPQAGKVGGEVEYWPVSMYESIKRDERSSAVPRSGVDVGGARTRGVWRPRMGKGSNNVCKF